MWSTTIGSAKKNFFPQIALKVSPSDSRWSKTSLSQISLISDIIVASEVEILKSWDFLRGKTLQKFKFTIEQSCIFYLISEYERTGSNLYIRNRKIHLIRINRQFRRCILSHAHYIVLKSCLWFKISPSNLLSHSKFRYV